MSLETESTTILPADIGGSPGDRALIRPPSDSEDVFLPVNESFPPVDTDIMDTRDEEPLESTTNDTNEALGPATDLSAVSSSISIDSRTSTLKYDQEPSIQYQVRVKSLCHILWPAESWIATPDHRVGGVAKFRILDAVRIKKLRRFLTLSSEKGFTIERLAGGTYNRIVGITVKDSGTNVPKRLVLRIPRPYLAAYGSIGREVAILRYVRQNTTLPVADIISFDATANNPLESGYVVQSRLPGVSLHTIWDELSHAQRCTVAQEIGKIVLTLQSIKNPTPGIVEASPVGDGAQNFIVRPFDIKSPYDEDWKAKIPIYVSDEASEVATLDPLTWFGTQFGRWLAHELLQSPAQILYWDYQLQFVEAAKRMDSLGILGDGQNCLCHFDLAARNVMVEILPNGSLTISGIVDWDSAVFAPTFVSCAPPSWLWTDQKLYDTDELEASSTPSTPEQEEIKGAFEEVVGFDWEWFAYRPEFRLARELFYFAQHGLPDGMATTKAQKFLKAWAALYKTLTNPKNNGESSKDSPCEDEIRDGATDGVGQDVASERNE